MTEREMELLGIAAKEIAAAGHLMANGSGGIVSIKAEVSIKCGPDSIAQTFEIIQGEDHKGP